MNFGKDLQGMEAWEKQSSAPEGTYRPCDRFPEVEKGKFGVDQTGQIGSWKRESSFVCNSSKTLLVSKWFLGIIQLALKRRLCLERMG